MAHALPTWLSGAIVLGAVAGMRWLEARRPLRRATEDPRRRDVRNVSLAALSAAALWLVERPVTVRLAARRWGLLPRLGLPTWLDVAAAVVLLDYTLWVWHVATHRVPALWRFHEVHHADRDLSVSTALRFHFGEMMLSVPWRAAQIVVVGATPLSLSVWQTATLVAIVFHHANAALPLGLERRLCRVFMTPRLHGIHHSVVDDETNSNWSTIFSWPDWVHGTIRPDVPQDAIEIGAPAVRGAAVRAVRDLLVRPFVRASRVARVCTRGAAALR